MFLLTCCDRILLSFACFLFVDCIVLFYFFYFITFSVCLFFVLLFVCLLFGSALSVWLYNIDFNFYLISWDLTNILLINCIRISVCLIIKYINFNFKKFRNFNFTTVYSSNQIFELRNDIISAPPPRCTPTESKRRCCIRWRAWRTRTGCLPHACGALADLSPPAPPFRPCGKAVAAGWRTWRCFCPEFAAAPRDDGEIDLL